MSWRTDMALLGIKQAFAIYGATLHNVQWSVSAWAPDDSLVLSLWAHHYRKGPGDTADYADSLARWSKLRLSVVSTLETSHVQAGGYASKVKKDFDAKNGLVGEVAELDADP